MSRWDHHASFSDFSEQLRHKTQLDQTSAENTNLHSAPHLLPPAPVWTFQQANSLTWPGDDIYLFLSRILWWNGPFYPHSSQNLTKIACVSTLPSNPHFCLVFSFLYFWGSSDKDSLAYSLTMASCPQQCVFFPRNTISVGLRFSIYKAISCALSCGYRKRQSAA